MAHSTNKLYESVFSTVNPINSGDVRKFPLFRDQDIGINEYWQTYLIESVK
jgi:hypothetical protein